MNFTATAGGGNQDGKVLEQARASAFRALGRVSTSAEDEQEFVRLNEYSAARRVDDTLALHRLGIPLTEGLAACILRRQVRFWQEGGAFAFDNFEAVHRLDVKKTGNDLLPPVMDVLLQLEGGGKPRLGDRGALADAFGRIATVLEKRGHLEDALACAVTATNAIPGFDHKLIAPSIAHAVSLARRLGSRDVVGTCLARRAVSLLRAKGDVDRLDVFTAIEELIREPPDAAGIRKVAFDMLRPHLDELGERLRTFVYLALVREGLRQSNAPEALQFVPLLSTEWNVPAEELPGAIEIARDLVIEVEEERLALLPPVADDQAEVDWVDFSMSHPVLRHSMPFRQSLRKIARHQETLLELNHELTHVTCLTSHVGNALLAIRAALFETETDLWALLAYQGKEKITADVFTRGLAPLRTGEGDPLALAYAERELELALKAAALRETWGPWFEGLAVFAELHGDSTPDHAMSIMSLVIVNLEDHPLAQAASKAGVDPTQLYAQRQREAERLYAEAARDVGPFRLRTYLERHAAKYLPGYLAVRAVVASWRRRLPAGLGGAQALRALLHITKHGSEEAIPDLGLPLQEFRAKAREGMRAWLETISGVSADDLTRLLAPGDVRSMWRRGRLVVSDPDAAAATVEETFRGRVEQALSTLAGARGSPERVEYFGDSAGESIFNGILETVAQSLASRKRGQVTLSYERMDRLISRYLILPIAETTAPFWLNIPTQTVVALIRTGTDAESGENVYLPAQIKLPVEDWNSLRDVVKTSGAARLTITRVTEISNEVAQRWPTQGLGAHFLALRLGTWMYVVPAGAFLGAHDAAPELVALVRHRLSPNPIAAMEEGVTSLAVRCAERTMNWVGKVKSWRLGDDIYPLAPWAVHVLNLGYDVARERGADPAQAEACNRELLLFVFGDGVMADGVAAGGLALGADDRSWFGAATRLLADTGAAPLTELPAAAKEIPSDVLGTFFERTDRGWDVRVPAHLRGVAE